MLLDQSNPGQLEWYQTQSIRCPLDTQSLKQCHIRCQTVPPSDHFDIRLQSFRRTANNSQLHQRILWNPTIPSVNQIWIRSYQEDFPSRHDQTHRNRVKIHPRYCPRMHQVFKRAVWEKRDQKETKGTNWSQNEKNYNWSWRVPWGRSHERINTLQQSKTSHMQRARV